ncbi:GNAT family N-acetyltransferase [uncultured Mailhella sp.]|uniref:GNAT family N-acetyltransferase n=1 Tax=uncultured Mailhella sp. TaxID=1981031 RepID=UPI00262C1B0B|nr:GNAT family N-acetyltransferase [uncultured Mailhella sp.]
MNRQGSLTLRPAAPEDLDALVRLEKSIEHALPSRDIFATDERPFYEPIVCGQGNILLAVDAHGELAGASVIRFPAPDDPEHLGRILHLPETLLRSVRHLESIFVRPEDRGRGLAETLLHENMRLTAASGRTLSMATVWPGNTVSLRLHFRAGLCVCAFARKYGGRPRFILAGGPQRPRLESVPLLIPAADVETQRKALAQGYVGFRVQGETLLYARLHGQSLLGWLETP